MLSRCYDNFGGKTPNGRNRLTGYVYIQKNNHSPASFSAGSGRGWKLENWNK